MQEFLKQIITEAGVLAKDYYNKGVKSNIKSSPSDLVTEADQETSKFLIKKIRKEYPEHSIISEEEKEEINPGGVYTWVIDPIDGTRNFANHIGFWCTMIGITKNDKPYMAAIYDALNDELFFAKVGFGAYLNDKKISVNNVEDFEHCFYSFSCGSKVNPVYKTDKFDDYLKVLNKIAKLTGELMFYRHGSMLKDCHIAAGRTDASFSNGGLYHDHLAPFIIVTEAGGMYTNSLGRTWQRGDTDSVVANPLLHKKLLQLFKD